jgi:hypothetical protein
MAARGEAQLLPLVDTPAAVCASTGLLATLAEPAPAADTLECRNDLKWRKKKMNRHKYKKWKKRNSSLFSKFGSVGR